VLYTNFTFSKNLKSCLLLCVNYSHAKEAASSPKTGVLAASLS